MLLRRKHTPIGIDIGETGLKLVQFRKTQHGLDLQAAGSLEAHCLAAEDTDEGAALVRDLRKVLAKRRFGCRRAVITLPPSEVSIRPLTLPADAHDVAKKVRWEAESYLGYDIEDAVIDHIVLGETKGARDARLEVLAAAVQKDRVLRWLNLLGRAGLETEAVDVAPLALCRLLLRLGAVTDGAAAAVDIGASSTHTVIADGDQLRMSRTIAIGGDTFTKVIAAALEVSVEEAEALKRQHGSGAAIPDAQPEVDGVPSEECAKIARIVHDIMREKIEFLVAELSKLFRYFSAQNQGRRVERVLLVGGGGALKGLDTLLAKRLEARVEAGAPISQLTGQSVKLRQENERSFAVAAGLALREE